MLLVRATAGSASRRNTGMPVDGGRGAGEGESAARLAMSSSSPAICHAFWRLNAEPRFLRRDMFAGEAFLEDEKAGEAFLEDEKAGDAFLEDEKTGEVL